jgi:uncharacterized membrane protein YfcA
VTPELAIFLFLASATGGALNAVAGGGSFLTLPALIYAGVPPVAANATSTMALWPGSLSAAWAYRREAALVSRWLARLALVSLAGGLLGAMLLVRTSDSSFLRLLPWLMLVAAVTFTFGGAATQRLRRSGPGTFGSLGGDPTLWTLLLQLVIATYGGYFGGGMGIMMLAVFAVTGMTDMHAMNGLKSLLAVAINGVALLEFVVAGSVAWTPGLVMVLGAVTGGYAGASLARRMDGRQVRTFVSVVAWLMTAYFFVRAA